MTLMRIPGRVSLAVAALCSVATVALAEPRKGGDVVFAQTAPPPTLDQTFSTSISTRNIAMHVFETLVTRDDDNGVVLGLADSYDISPDGLTYTFKLRDGVTFHDGTEMTSEDVLASFERYKRTAVAKGTLDPVASMAAPDPDTFVITLKEKVPVFLEELSAFVVPIVIHPAEQADKEPGKLEPIGTGPYKFVEWVPDSHVKLERFDDYAPDERYEGNAGFAGRKVAYFDTVTFKLVPEDGARVAGLETGELDIIEELPVKAAQRLKDHPEIQIFDLPYWWLHAAWVNHAKPPTNDLKVRRAIQIALDMEEVMEIATDGAYTLQPGLQYPGNPYYTTAGEQHYNVANPEKAKELLAEAGYGGEEFVIITNSSYQSMYNAAVVVAERLKQIGLNVRMDVYDWATAMEKRREKDAWNLWFTGQGTGPSVGPFTALKDVVSPQLNQFEPDPELDAIYAEMIRGETQEERKDAFARFQERVYDQVTFLKFGDLTRKQAARSNVEGFDPFRIPRLWNVWFKQ